MFTILFSPSHCKYKQNLVVLVKDYIKEKGDITQMNWESNVRKVVPYVPGEQPKQENVIKLNTNECPYPPSPKVEKALREFQTDRLRLYPDPAGMQLIDSLSDYYHIDKEQIFAGVGSDDVLAMAFLTFFNSGKPILFPNITYSFYDVWADLYRIPYECQPLDENFHIHTEDYKKENGGIVIANPNAPTGVALDLTAIEEIVQANQDVVVIVDEAYIDFGGTSALPLIDKYDNLLVVQTFSKSRAMAGIRIGYAFGSKKLISYLNDAKYSFNSYTMNALTLALGAEAVKDDVYFKEITGKVIATRERVQKQLRELKFSFEDSSANFVFVTHERIPAKELFMMLREQGIYVRYWNKPIIDNYLRISIGTDEEMDALVEALATYIRKK